MFVMWLSQEKGFPGRGSNITRTMYKKALYISTVSCSLALRVINTVLERKWKALKFIDLDLEEGKATHINCIRISFEYFIQLISKFTGYYLSYIYTQ